MFNNKLFKCEVKVKCLSLGDFLFDLFRETLFSEADIWSGVGISLHFNMHANTFAVRKSCDLTQFESGIISLHEK